MPDPHFQDQLTVLLMQTEQQRHVLAELLNQMRLNPAGSSAAAAVKPATLPATNPSTITGTNDIFSVLVCLVAVGFVWNLTVSLLPASPSPPPRLPDRPHYKTKYKL